MSFDIQNKCLSSQLVTVSTGGFDVLIFRRASGTAIFINWSFSSVVCRRREPFTDGLAKYRILGVKCKYCSMYWKLKLRTFTKFWFFFKTFTLKTIIIERNFLSKHDQLEKIYNRWKKNRKITHHRNTSIRN